MSFNFNEPLLCPLCGSNCQIQRKIWVTPGEDSVNTGDIDYEENVDDSRVYCNGCNETFYFNEMEEMRCENDEAVHSD